MKKTEVMSNGFTKTTVGFGPLERVSLAETETGKQGDSVWWRFWLFRGKKEWTGCYLEYYRMFYCGWSHTLSAKIVPFAEASIGFWARGAVDTSLYFWPRRSAGDGRLLKLALSW